MVNPNAVTLLCFLIMCDFVFVLLVIVQFLVRKHFAIVIV